MADITNLAHLIEHRDHLTAEINERMAERADIDSMIKEAMSDDEYGYVDGKPAFRHSRSARRAIDVVRLRLKDPALAAKYTKVTWPTRFERIVPE